MIPSQVQDTPAVTDVTPFACPYEFLEVSVRGRTVRKRWHILHSAPDHYLGEYLTGEIGAFFTLGKLRFTVEDPKRWRAENHRVIVEYRRQAQELPDLSLAERRKLTDEQLWALIKRIQNVYCLFTWVNILLRMESARMGIPMSELYAKLNVLPEHKLADKLRLWAWRQTDAGKHSTAKSRAKIKAKKPKAPKIPKRSNVIQFRRKTGS